MRIRPLAIVAAGIVLAAQSACSAQPVSPPGRTEPDQIEKSAVLAAQFHALEAGVEVPSDAWVQLWTPASGGKRIRDCVSHDSAGTVDFQADPIARSSSGLSYSVGVSADTRNGVFDAPNSIEEMVDTCLALSPIDYRMGAVPERDRAALYAYDLTTLRRCLIAHGQKVPKLPTRERFENLMRASAPWNAYDEVVVGNRRAWYALADACPAFPLAIAGDIAASTKSATTP